ncbi:MAG: BON domain-containing protein [Acidobacteria bacterium]|nr:BON domain-containing protein [Acidobacteriota bacterium]
MAGTRTGHIIVLGLGLTLALALTSACGNTAEGVKQDSRENTEKAREGAQAVKEETKDATPTIGAEAKDLGSAIKQETKEVGSKIAGGAKEVASDVAAKTQTLEVKTALLAAKGIDASHIDVDTDAETKTVTLKGSVPTTDQKEAAERVARDKASGYTVRNLLTVVSR